MNNEMTELKIQFERLSNELSNAQQNIRRLEKRSVWRPNALALVCMSLVAALGVSSFGAKASSLDEPRSPSNISSDVPTKVKAPFEVDDKDGHAIMIVREDNGPNGSIDRGVYVFNEAQQAVIHLRSTSDDGGGGRIRVGDGITGALTENGIGNGLEISGTQQKSGLQVIRGGKKVASIGAEQGDKLVESGGSVQVFGDGEKPVVSLSKGKNGGEVGVYDAKNKKAATLGTETGGGSLNVYGSGDKPKAYVGTNGDGDGAVFVYSNNKNPVAGLSTYDGGKGLVSVFANNTPIAFMAESDKHPGGGNFTATNTAGDGIFSAGFTGEGGDACVNRAKGGLKCLGVGLPLQINE